MIETRIVAMELGLGEAVEMLRAGEVVAFPTETVYGLGADARREDAIGRIYAAKGRPAGNPVIVHVADGEAARRCAAEWLPAAERLARRFWPGPLTMVVPRGEGISSSVSAGRKTVALRCPNHPVAQALLRAFGGPVAAPSANRSGFTSPTTAGHVRAELAGRVALILDGGECAIGLESTVVDLSGEGGGPTILRPGAVTVEMLRAVIGHVEVLNQSVATGDNAASPGTYDRHYAPRTPAYRFARGDWKRAMEFAAGHGPVALLSWSDEVVLPAPHETMRLPEEGAAYARVLYAALRAADEREAGGGGSSILVLLPDKEEGLWAAVLDRLRRATVPLPE